MRVKIERSSQIELTVVALQGLFKGQRIASVEGIALCNASFEGPFIMGQSLAVWGATLNDAICTDAPTLFGLGINRPFPVLDRWQAEWDGARYIDTKSGREVKQARIAILVHGAIHYE